MTLGKGIPEKPAEPLKDVPKFVDNLTVEDVKAIREMSVRIAETDSKAFSIPLGEGAQFFASKVGDRIVAISEVSFPIDEDINLAVIGGIFVEPEYRDHKVGEVLVENVIRQLKRKKSPTIQRVRIFIPSTRKSTENLAKNLGFKLDHQTTDGALFELDLREEEKVD